MQNDAVIMLTWSDWETGRQPLSLRVEVPKRGAFFLQHKYQTAGTIYKELT